MGKHMGKFSPYWDGRLPILGVDDWFARHRWDTVATGFSLRWPRLSCWTVRANPAANSFALRSNLAAVAGASSGSNPDHNELIRKEDFELSTRRVPFSPHLAVKATRSSGGDGEPGNRRLMCDLALPWKPMPKGRGAFRNGLPHEFSKYAVGYRNGRVISRRICAEVARASLKHLRPNVA